MPDDAGQVWNLRLVWHGKPRAEVIPEGDAELGAGLVVTESIDLSKELAILLQNCYAYSVALNLCYWLAFVNLC